MKCHLQHKTYFCLWQQAGVKMQKLPVCFQSYEQSTFIKWNRVSRWRWVSCQGGSTDKIYQHLHSSFRFLFFFFLNHGNTVHVTFNELKRWFKSLFWKCTSAWTVWCFFFPPVSPHGHLFDVTHCAKQEWKLVRCKERQQDKKIEKASL